MHLRSLYYFHSSLQYSWKIFNNFVLQPSVQSISKDPSVLKLPRYTLVAGNTYQISVTVTAQSNKMAQAMVQIFVAHDRIYAVIAGGNVQSVPISPPLLLDASGQKSWDSDLYLMF